MPFLQVIPHPEPQATFTDEQKAVFAKLRGIRFSTEKGGIPRQILDSNLRIVRGHILSSKEEVKQIKDDIAYEIEKAIKANPSKNITYIDFTLLNYDKTKESEHRLRTYKPDGTLRIGIHSRNDLETEDITDKYDKMEDFTIIENVPEINDIKITLYDLTDDMYNSVLELNPSFIADNNKNSNSVLKYGKLATLTASLHALSLDGKMDELNGKSIIFKSARDYIGDDSENVLLFDFLGHMDDGSQQDTADIITKDLDTAAKQLHSCIWLINISERGRPDGSAQYDLHTRINITLAFSKCKNSGTFYVNGVPFDYEAHGDFSELIREIGVDSEGVLQDPKFPEGIGADNPGNILILNRYLGTIARYKKFDTQNKPNEWFETYLKLITNMSDVEFYEFASEILRNIMIICSQKELGITLFKMARTRFCAHEYCHTEIDPTFPVNLNIPRFIPIEPLEVETHCGCPDKGEQQS